MDRIVEVCTIFGNGRIQLKKKVRVILDVNDGDDVYFKIASDGRMYVEKGVAELKSGSAKYVRSEG